mmetsp:Transcript_14155/g.44566  ORF Transcript_14155/g.44566 Transcript_14155/m.44566 type:complete len:339 (-) Transcript_14155:245-1261(-)
MLSLIADDRASDVLAAVTARSREIAAASSELERRRAADDEPSSTELSTSSKGSSSPCGGSGGAGFAAALRFLGGSLGGSAGGGASSAVPALLASSPAAAAEVGTPGIGEMGGGGCATARAGAGGVDSGSGGGREGVGSRGDRGDRCGCTGRRGVAPGTADVDDARDMRLCTMPKSDREAGAACCAAAAGSSAPWAAGAAAVGTMRSLVRRRVSGAVGSALDELSSVVVVCGLADGVRVELVVPARALADVTRWSTSAQSQCWKATTKRVCRSSRALRVARSLTDGKVEYERRKRKMPLIFLSSTDPSKGNEAMVPAAMVKESLSCVAPATFTSVTTIG